jgi:hypothetical protein
MQLGLTFLHQSEPSLSPPEETTCGNLMLAIGAGAGAASSGFSEPERGRGAGAGAGDVSAAGFDAGEAAEGGWLLGISGMAREEGLEGSFLVSSPPTPARLACSK